MAMRIGHLPRPTRMKVIAVSRVAAPPKNQRGMEPGLRLQKISSSSSWRLNLNPNLRRRIIPRHQWIWILKRNRRRVKVGRWLRYGLIWRAGFSFLIFLQLRFRLMLWVRFSYCHSKIWHGLAIFLYPIIYILDLGPRSSGQNKNLHSIHLQFSKPTQYLIQVRLFFHIIIRIGYYHSSISIHVLYIIIAPNANLRYTLKWSTTESTELESIGLDAL